MKKPINNYEVEYPVNENCNYYDPCESSNATCTSCNTGGNTSGNGNGSGNSASVGSWGK